MSKTHTIITGFASKHHCDVCNFESYDATSMLNHTVNTEWPDAISWDDLQREPEIEERDECNTCGRTEYMCPGH